VVIALLVKLQDGGPVFFRQVRVGRDGRRFRLWKFRSMTCGMPQNGLDLTVGDDPRVTPVGAWLRRLKLDEIPQLLNILAGEMSLVGPRPEVPYALADYEPWMYRRFDVLPGITGLWQVRGRGLIGVRGMLQLDVEYAEECDLAVDLEILVKTLPAVLRGTGAA